MSQIHDRMPVMLDPAAYDTWTDPATPISEVKPLLDRHLDGELRSYRVGWGVNTFKTKGGECIEPLNPV